MGNERKGLHGRAATAFWAVWPSLAGQIRACLHQQASARYGLTMEQFLILRHIREGQDSVRALAEARGISRAAVSQAVDALVDRGLVARRPDPADRRRVRLALTPRGHALLRALARDAHRWLEGRLAPLSPAELRVLLRAMEILQRAVGGGERPVPPPPPRGRRRRPRQGVPSGS